MPPRGASVPRGPGGALAGALAGLVAACATASGDVSGGALTYDAAAPPCAIGARAGAPATWSGLYDDYFGPSGEASCSRVAGGCHGSPADSAAARTGFVCGADKAACYASVRTLVPAGVAPEATGLLGVLRRDGPEGGPKTVGFMPQSPACAFSGEAVERISSWIRQGAKDD